MKRKILLKLKNKFNLKFLIILILLNIIPLSFACISANVDDNYINNDTLICMDYYLLDDNESSYDIDYGTFIINNSNIELDCNNAIFDGQKHGLFLISNFGVENVTIKNCNIINFTSGIKIQGSNFSIINSTFSNINFTGNETSEDNIAIYLDSSHNSTIKNVNVSNSNIGFSLGYDLRYLNIFNSNLFNISYRAIDSFALKYSNFSNITIKNSQNGLNFDEGNNNSINNLTLINISSKGIYFYGTSNSTIKNSNFTNNNIGLLIEQRSSIKAYNNLIYNNYFSSNNININTTDQINNYFNSSKIQVKNIIGGNYSGGNFYSDYNGVDSNGDGIGDSYYNIISNETNIYDYLPLTNNLNLNNNSSLNKSFKVNFVNFTNYFENDSIYFNINFSNMTGIINLSISEPCLNNNITNISSGYIYECKILNDGNFNISFNLIDSDSNYYDFKLVNVSNIPPYNIIYLAEKNQNTSYSFNLSFQDNGSLDKFNITINWGDNLTTYLNNTLNKTNLIFNHNYLKDGIYDINVSIFDGINESYYIQNENIITDKFNLIKSKEVLINSLFNITLFIKNIVSISNLTINWTDNIYFENNSSKILNGTIYNHSYSNFGNYLISAKLFGCKNQTICSNLNEYQTSIIISVIGYGDGIINGNESCDNSNFGDKTCFSFGFNAGSLTCDNGNIKTNNCYTLSSGGSSRHRDKKVEDDKLNPINIRNETLNYNNTNNNLSLFNNTNINNITKEYKYNLSNLINNTYKKNNNTHKINNKSEENKFRKNLNNLEKLNLENKNNYNLTNIIKIIPKQNYTKFDFKPYLNILFNLFIDEIPKEEYEFKSKISLIFTQFFNEIKLNKNLTLNINESLNITNSTFTFKPFLENVFYNKETSDNFSFKPYLNKVFSKKNEEDKGNKFSFENYLNKVFKKEEQNGTQNY